MMDTAASFQFLQPLWLLLLPPSWVLVWTFARQAGRKSIWSRVCDEQLLAHMTAGQNSSLGYALPAWLLGSVLSLGIVAAAAPSWSKLSHPIMEATDARVIVLDLSRSMLVQDVRPSRFEHALAAASEVIDSDYAGETGLVVFAGSAFVLSPLSRDADTLLAFVEAVHPDSMPQDGSNLKHAITTARDLLAASLGDRAQILLISSGDSHDQNALHDNAVQAAFDAATEGLRISVLGIGTVAGGPLLDLKGGLLRDSAGGIEISRPNFDLLRRIASAGQGSMTVVDGAGVSSNLNGNLNSYLLSSRLEASALAESRQGADQTSRDASDDGAWLVWWMLPLVLILFRKNMVFVFLIALLLQGEQESYAADHSLAGDSLARHQPARAFEFWTHPEKIAFGAYHRGDYDTAHATSESPMLVGASYYRSHQFKQALAQFSENDSAASIYNRGNTLVQLQRYPEAIVAFQQAFDLDPQLINAAYNRRLVEIFLEQQAASAGNDQEAAINGEAMGETIDPDATEMLIGIATEMQGNPADDQQPGSGSGDSQEAGQVDPLEHFDGEDLDEERFALRAQGPGQELDMEIIERWISSLPETSNELYRRKFLRDFQRQQQQVR
jgi:Ca-activated chloride channel family protein